MAKFFWLWNDEGTQARRWVEEEGRPCTIRGFDVYIHEEEGRYSIIEKTSGRRIGTGITAYDALNSADDLIDEFGVDEIQRQIKISVSQFGASPLLH